MPRALICACGAPLERTGSRGPLPSVCANCKRRNADLATKRWREANCERNLAAQRIRIQRWKDRNREKVQAEARAYHQRLRETDPNYHERMRERSVKFRLADPERWKAIQRASYRRHAEKRRAEQADRREIAGQERLAIYERDGGRCHICGGRVPRDDFHLDHLIPVSSGGLTTPENLALAHPHCNQSRGKGRLPAQLRLVG